MTTTITATPIPPRDGNFCTVCGLDGADVKIKPCDCMVHISCLPLRYFIKKSEFKQSAAVAAAVETDETKQSEDDVLSSPTLAPTIPTSSSLPENLTGSTLYLLPMELDSFHPSSSSSSSCTTSKEEKETFLKSLLPVFPDQTILDNKEIIIDEDVQIRNGRWTADEIKFVDELIKRFNDGTLLLPNSGSLNNFLRSLFLCKGTRLRKKIKNANFCTRLYNISRKLDDDDHKDTIISDPSGKNDRSLSILQNKFIQSLDCQEDRNLLTFNLKRMWMTHFFNYCIQIGFESLDATDWLESLESIEKQVQSFKSCTTTSQRHHHNNNHHHRPPLVSNTTSNVHAPVPKKDNDIRFIPQKVESQNPAADGGGEFTGGWDDLSVNDGTEFGLPMPPALVPFEIREQVDLEVMSEISDHLSHSTESALKRKTYNCSTSEGDPRFALSSKRPKKPDISTSSPSTSSPSSSSSKQISEVCEKFGKWTPFVQKITTMIESNNFPFQYFDVWYATAPASTNQHHNINEKDNKNNNKSDKVVLHHVGHSALDDVDSIWNLYHMNRFGEYSSNFVFSPGEGLPGRVIASGLPTWDDSIQKLSSHVFPRVHGARNHGIKKGLGIPMVHSTYGHIVVAMYSINDVPKDINLLQQCCTHFNLSYPKAKWDLILRADGDVPTKSSTTGRDSEEVAIIDLLSKYSSAEAQFEGNFVALRMLLLKEPSKRKNQDQSAVQMIKASFRDYQNSNKEDQQIATLLVQEWQFIDKEQQSNLSSPLQLPCSPIKAEPTQFSISHTNYAHQ